MSAIKVLQVLAGAKEYNGVSDFLLTYYSHLDRNKIHFDFLFCRENTYASKMDNPVLQGSQFIELKCPITGKTGDLIRLIKKLTNEFKSNHYDIVHINTGSISITYCCVVAAKKAGIKHIISHSHNTDSKGTHNKHSAKIIVRSALNSMMRWYIRDNCSLLFACSKEAGEYLFGKSAVYLEKYYLIPNAIQTEKFLFDSKKRIDLRKKYGIGNETIVVGCVGRLSEQKNQQFLIDVFSDYQKLNSDSQLWLVGDGDKRKALEEKALQKCSTGSVVFWGQRSDVSELLQAMDMFVLTSYYEGLGICSIEAQTAGLKVILPDEISHGSDISDLVQFIPLSAGPQKWASVINSEMTQKNKRENMYSVIVNSGYDIAHAVRTLEEKYTTLIQLD